MALPFTDKWNDKEAYVFHGGMETNGLNVVRPAYSNNLEVRIGRRTYYVYEYVCNSLFTFYSLSRKDEYLYLGILYWHRTKRTVVGDFEKIYIGDVDLSFGEGGIWWGGNNS